MTDFCCKRPLGFPNREVEKSFMEVLVPAYVGQEEIPCNNAQRTAATGASSTVESVVQ